jgi:hypothetical protein
MSVVNVNPIIHDVLIVCCVYKVSLSTVIVSVDILPRDASSSYTQIEVGIKQLEGALLIHGAHAEFPPFIPDAHGP